jgi:hypothetical protein
MVRKIDVKAGTLLGTCAVQRGGNWDNGAQAGVFSMNVNNAPSNSNTNIGFRCPPNFSGENPVIQSLDAGAKPICGGRTSVLACPTDEKSGGEKLSKSGRQPVTLC